MWEPLFITVNHLNEVRKMTKLNKIDKN